MKYVIDSIPKKIGWFIDHQWPTYRDPNHSCTFVIPYSPYLTSTPDPNAPVLIYIVAGERDVLGQINITPLRGENSLMTIRADSKREHLWRDALHNFISVLRGLGWSIDVAKRPLEKRGRKTLSHDETIERLAKAKWARELREIRPDLEWLEIRERVSFKYGRNPKSDLRLLRFAIDKLEVEERLQKVHILNEVDRLVEKMKK